jgi:glyoxylase-like metal-dependent hydrolase (beta-lactamase superfamily II)
MTPVEEHEQAQADESRAQGGACHRGIFSIEGDLPAFMFPPTMTYDPLGGGLWTISEGIYRTVFAEGRTGVVAFDTFWSPAAADVYRQAVARVLPGKDIHTVVYSHDHLDHTGFAADLAPHANVIAHESCAQVVQARGSDGQTVPTDVWTGDHKELSIDGVEFELIHPGPTHGNGNVAAFFPQVRTLFMVDTVIPGVGYTFFPDWHLSTYRESMQKLRARDGWDRFVPGHFWLLDREGFDHSLEYYDAVADCAQRALEAGVDSDDLCEVTAYANEHLTEEFGELFRFQEYAGMNLMRFMLHFRTGSWGLEDNGGAHA